MVRSEMLQDRPDDVRAMIAALLRAWADTARDPAGTIDAAAQSEYKESFLERDALVEYMRLELANLQTADTDLHGLGYSTNDEWQSLLKVLQKYGDLSEVLLPDSYYSNEYLPQNPINP
jgi:NitT/TauT family transport system substrate-binding protein